jgi:hypothetical protein
LTINSSGRRVIWVMVDPGSNGNGVEAKGRRGEIKSERVTIEREWKKG